LLCLYGKTKWVWPLGIKYCMIMIVNFIFNILLLIVII